jgi:hypothetical protein
LRTEQVRQGSWQLADHCIAVLLSIRKPETEKVYRVMLVLGDRAGVSTFLIVIEDRLPAVLTTRVN